MNKLTPLKKFNSAINQSMIESENSDTRPDFLRFSLALKKCETIEKKKKMLNDENSTIGQHINPSELFGQVGKSSPPKPFIKRSNALLWKQPSPD